MENLTEMLKGVLEGCVLEIIGREETYGYEITRRLNALGFADVVEGTVYAILVRLERNGLVETQKKPSELGPPRKFYTLNDMGREELVRFWAKWEFVASKINELKESRCRTRSPISRRSPARSASTARPWSASRRCPRTTASYTTRSSTICGTMWPATAWT